jgi:hypothetical protein
VTRQDVTLEELLSNRSSFSGDFTPQFWAHGETQKEQREMMVSWVVS